MDASEDRELLDAWRGGDRKAADRLIVRHYDLIRRTIQTKTPEQAVDDLTQQVLTALVEGRDQIREGASVRAYIVTIARRIVADYYRRRQGKPLADEDIAERPVADLGAGPITLLLARRESRLLLEALRQLPLQDQFILELYYWEDLSGPELAQALECTEPAIRSKLRRAKEHLTAKLGELTRERSELADTLTDLDTWAHKLRDELRAAFPGLAPTSPAGPV